MFKVLIYNGERYDNFEINEYGDIRNLKTGRILKKSINKQGYYFTTIPLNKRGNVKYIRNHKAVAETFIPNPNNYSVAHHKDEDKLNCHISNIEWVTSQKNIHEHWKIKQEETPYFNNRKLTEKDIEFIRANDGKISNRQMAKMFDVSHVTIINVKKGYLYKGKY